MKNIQSLVLTIGDFGQKQLSDDEYFCLCDKVDSCIWPVVERDDPKLPYKSFDIIQLL